MKNILVILAALLSYNVAQAQNLCDYLKKAPSSLFMSVDSLNREKLMASGKVNTDIVTMFGDTIDVRCSTPRFMSLSYANKKTQIKLIDDYIIVAETYSAPSENSEVMFYDTEWNLKSQWIYGVRHSRCMPGDKNIYKEIIIRPDTMDEETFRRLELYFDPLLVSAELQENADEIVVRPGYAMLTEDEIKRVKPLIKQKTFKWTKGKFK